MVVGSMAEEIDVFVVGAGPGGYVAAIRAAQLGKSVVVAERRELGGVCLNEGCIPSKALIEAAHRFEQMKHASAIGIAAGDVSVDFAKVQEWKNGIVRKQAGGVASLLKGNKVRVVKGEAFFNGPDTATISPENEDAAPVRFRFRHAIIATGSRPVELPGFPFGGRILSSTEALRLDEVPRRLAVVGGGYVGVELGQTFAKFGAEVTILEARSAILPEFEDEATRWVVRGLRKNGVRILTGVKAKEARQDENGVTVVYEEGGEEKQLVADYVLVTVGRRPNTEGIGLEGIGVRRDARGLIEVDGQCRTSVPHLFAIGDVVAGPALAHKASYEGKVAAEAIAGLPSRVDYRAIPAVVFSDPEIASVGLTETEAKAQGLDVAVGRFSYGANGRAQTLDAGEGFVKVIARKPDGVVVGAQIVGAEASNLISEFALAIEMGATLEDVALTIHPHPTLGEMAMEAAEGALGRPIHQLVR